MARMAGYWIRFHLGRRGGSDGGCSSNLISPGGVVFPHTLRGVQTALDDSHGSLLFLGTFGLFCFPRPPRVKIKSTTRKETIVHQIKRTLLKHKQIHTRKKKKKNGNTQPKKTLPRKQTKPTNKQKRKAKRQRSLKKPNPPTDPPTTPKAKSRPLNKFVQPAQKKYT